jgi:hypothetical protein
VIWKPVLVRAAVALGFGALTVFWASPSQAGMGWAGGLYLLATGGAALDREPVRPGRVRTKQNVAAAEAC